MKAKTTTTRAKASATRVGAKRKVAGLRLPVRSILVPIDFSEPSCKALSYAGAFARVFGSRLTLLYVIEPAAYPDFAAFPLVISDDKVATSAVMHLKQMAARHARDCVVERAVVRHGVPFKEITAAASEFETDLIVISTHGRTGVAHVVLGSTAERVVRHASCPVLVAREKEREFV